MKESPVLELQVLAQSSSHKLSDLLRKALVVATKLGLNDFKEWIEKELKGYPTTEVPDYRKRSSEYYYRNPYHGLQPLGIPDEDLKKRLCAVSICDSVETLQHYVDTESETGSIGYSIPPKWEENIRKGCDLMDMPLVRLINISCMTAILDAVRTRILEWALQLEAEGILGEGVSFSSKEKEKAQASQVITIGNFQGVLGNVHHSSVEQSFTDGVKVNDMASLLRAMRELGADDEDLAELENAVKQDAKGDTNKGFGTKVSGWIGKMVGKAAEGGLKVAVEVSSGVITAMLKSYYGLP